MGRVVPKIKFALFSRKKAQTTFKNGTNLNTQLNNLSAAAEQTRFEPKCLELHLQGGGILPTTLSLSLSLSSAGFWETLGWT